MDTHMTIGNSANARAEFDTLGNAILSIPAHPWLTKAIEREIPASAMHVSPDRASWLVAAEWAVIGCRLLRQAFPDAPIHPPRQGPQVLGND